MRRGTSSHPSNLALTCMPFGRASLAHPERLSCLPPPPSRLQGDSVGRVRRREHGSCQHTADADLRRWWTKRRPDRRCAGASWMAGAFFRHDLPYRRTGVPPARDDPRPASARPRDRQPLAHPSAQDVPLHGSAAPGRVGPQHRDARATFSAKRITCASVPGGYNSDLVVRTAADAGVRFLFTSQPTARAHRVGDMWVIGRYVLMRSTSAAVAAAIAAGDLTPRLWQAAVWNVKGAVQATRWLAVPVGARADPRSIVARPVGRRSRAQPPAGIRRCVVAGP